MKPNSLVRNSLTLTSCFSAATVMKAVVIAHAAVVEIRASKFETFAIIHLIKRAGTRTMIAAPSNCAAGKANSFRSLVKDGIKPPSS